MFRTQYGNPYFHSDMRLGFVIFCLVIFVAALIALAFLVRVAMNQRSGRPLLFGQHTSMPTQSQALHILDERFAKGEIDEDEYRRRRDALREHTGL